MIPRCVEGTIGLSATVTKRCLVRGCPWTITTEFAAMILSHVDHMGTHTQAERDAVEKNAQTVLDKIAWAKRAGRW